jgi:hypothetical protein
MTEITLRRANKLRAKCEEKLQDIRRELSNTTVNVNLFSENAQGKVAEKQEQISRNIARFTALNNAIIDLRVAIATANITTGVSEKLALINGYARLADMYRQLTHSEASPTQSEMQSLINARRQNFETSSAALYRDDVVFSVLRKDVIDTATAALENDIVPRVSKLQDDVEQANATGKVELDDTVVAILTSEKLI